MTGTWHATAPIIYSGHDPPTVVPVFATDKASIAAVLALADAGTPAADASAQMVARYPTYANVDFLLAMSVANLPALASK